MNILILHNTVTTDRPDDEDTLVQVEEIGEALAELGYRHHSQAIMTLGEIEQAVTKHKPELVFNLIEHFGGSDAYIHLPAALLEILGVPYTGCSAQSLMLAGNKLFAKKIMLASGIPTPELAGEGNDKTRRYIVKSACEHASLGLDANSVVQGEKKARVLAAQKASQYGGDWLAETYIEGREINVTLLDGHVLPVAEMCFTDWPQDRARIVCYEGKWDASGVLYRKMQRRFISDRKLNARIKVLAMQCWDAFGLRGCARVDMRLDEAGGLWVIDLNANPCLSSDGGFMAVAQHEDISANAVIRRIVDAALRSEEEKMRHVM